MVCKGCCYAMGIYGVWSCYGYLGGVVMLWVFEDCGYVMAIQGALLCNGYLRDVVM